MLARIMGAIQGAIRGWKTTTTDPQFIDFLSGGSRSDSGSVVNTRTATRLSTVYACVQEISKTIAQLPRHVIRTNSGDTKKKKDVARDHYLYKIVKSRVNHSITSFHFFQTMTWNAVLTGNSWAYLVRDGMGRVLEIWPWPNEGVRVEEDGWDLKIYLRTKRGEIQVPENNILHMSGLQVSGRIGLSPLTAARETIGEGISLQRMGSSLLKNKMHAGGFIEIPTGTFRDNEEQKKWTTAFRESAAGDDSFKNVVLKPGMKYQEAKISMADAQWIEWCKFNQAEICSIFGMPLHKIQNLDRATFNNIEQLSLEYLLYCISPWLINWEQTMQLQLMHPDEDGVYEVKFNFDGLLRGDSRARWESFWRAVQSGALSPNEIRDLIDMNPFDGGDQYFVMKNLMAINNGKGKTPDADSETINA